MQSTRDRFLKEMAAVSHSSEVIVGYPTKQEADFANIDFATYEKMHWASVNTDSKPITDAGNKIMGMLKGAKQVRITTKEGTDLSFSMGDRYVFADDGVLSDKERTSKIMFERFANLPGGFMDFAANESSVNGKLIVPRSSCNFESARDIFRPE